MSEVETSSGGPPTPTKLNQPKLEGEALQQALRDQFDFYFSKQNLANDTFLLAQMNQHPNKSVPIDILASFRKVKNLTENKAAIIQALKQCKNCTVDEANGLVRSALKVERNTLILRDMPTDASESELRAAFEGRKGSLCANGKLLSLTPDINDTWFVTFDSESTCMDVCLDIQSNAFSDAAYMYRGKPIQARVKNESLNRGFYTGPSNGANNAPVAVVPGAPSTILIGGPVAPGAGVYNPYNNMVPVPSYYYPPQYMQPGFAVPGYGMPPQIGGTVPLISNNAVVSPTSAQTKTEKKLAAAAQHAASTAAAQAKKQEKRAKAAASTPIDATARPAQVDTPPAGADGTTAAAPKKKKEKKAKAAEAAIAVTDATLQPVDKSHLIGLYGHAPRLYSREHIAQVVEQFITQARANNSLMKRPETIGQCHDPEKVVLKEKPSNSFSILDPFPVIYPASPSPLLAAQPHHSGGLPFLELGSGALDAPYFQADSGFQGQPQTAGRRKSKSGEPGKKPTQGNNNGNKSARTTTQQPTPATSSPSMKPRSSPMLSSQPQPKIIAPPAIQPSSILATAATAAVPTKPTSFAAAALAAANAPQQPPQPKAAPAKPAAPKAAPTTTPPAEKKGENKDGQPKKEKAKKKPATTPTAAATNGAATATPATAAKPAVPVVNYASRVGSVSPAEAAAKAAAQKQAKEAAERAAAKKDAPASSSTTTSTNGASSSPSASAGAKTPESPSKAAFSYAAMIKKAPTPVATAPAPVAEKVVSPPATNTTAPTKSNNHHSHAPRTNDSTVAASAGPAKSDAGNWRAAQ